MAVQQQQQQRHCWPAGLGGWVNVAVESYRQPQWASFVAWQRHQRVGRAGRFEGQGTLGRPVRAVPVGPGLAAGTHTRAVEPLLQAVPPAPVAAAAAARDTMAVVLLRPAAAAAAAAVAAAAAGRDTKAVALLRPAAAAAAAAARDTRAVVLLRPAAAVAEGRDSQEASQQQQAAWVVAA